MEHTSEETPHQTEPHQEQVSDASEQEIVVEPREELAQSPDEEWAFEEQIKLANRDRKLRTWLMAGAFALLSGVTFIVKHFSQSSMEGAREHAAEALKAAAEPEEDYESASILKVLKVEDERDGATSLEDLTEAERAEARAALIKQVRQSPQLVLTHIEELAKHPFGVEAVLAVMKDDPYLLEGNWDDLIKAFSDPTPLLEASIALRPTAFLTDAVTPAHHKTLETSQDHVTQKVREVLSQSMSGDEKAKVLCLLDRLVKGLSIEDARALAGDEARFVKTLLEIVSTPDHAAAASLEEWLIDHFLENIGEMNRLHDAGPERRFATLQGMDAQALYTLLALDGGGLDESGEPVAYPSTYQGTFDRLLIQMVKGNISGDVLLEQMGEYHAEDFLNMAVQRGRFGDFLRTMKPEQQASFLRGIFDSIGEKTNVSGAAGIAADILRQIKDPIHIKLIAETVAEAFSRAPRDEPEMRAAYGVLSLVLDPQADWVPEDERDAFRLGDLSSLEMKDLEAKDGLIVERYFFYNDDDGRSSFAHFLADYENRPQWKIERHDGYVVISSKGSERTVKIFANEPSAAPNPEESERPDPAQEAMDKEGLTPTVAIHRGHIYHQDQTIERLPVSVKLLILGSCGGYATADQVVARHPDIQIVSTKMTGTKAVNDAVLRLLETDLRDETKIDWADFWAKTSKRLGNNPDFKHYVSPNEHYYATVAGRVLAYREATEATQDETTREVSSTP